MFVPQRVENEVICSAGALLGTPSASSAIITCIVLVLQRWFCSWCCVCCESTESAGTSIFAPLSGALLTVLAEGSKQSQIVSQRVAKRTATIHWPAGLACVRASPCGAEDGWCIQLNIKIPVARRSTLSKRPGSARCGPGAVRPATQRHSPPSRPKSRPWSRRCCHRPKTPRRKRYCMQRPQPSQENRRPTTPPRRR